MQHTSVPSNRKQTEGGQYQIDTAKCAVCYKCLIECPNDAIVAEHGVLEIQHPEYDVENDTKMISCLNCKVCVDACPTDGLKIEGVTWIMIIIDIRLTP